MNKRRFLSSRLAKALGLVTTSCSTAGRGDAGARRRALDGSADAPLFNLSAKVPESVGLVAKATSEG